MASGVFTEVLFALSFDGFRIKNHRQERLSLAKHGIVKASKEAKQYAKTAMKFAKSVTEIGDAIKKEIDRDPMYPMFRDFYGSYIARLSNETLRHWRNFQEDSHKMGIAKTKRGSESVNQTQNGESEDGLIKSLVDTVEAESAEEEEEEGESPEKKRKKAETDEKNSETDEKEEDEEEDFGKRLRWRSSICGMWK